MSQETKLKLNANFNKIMLNFDLNTNNSQLNFTQKAEKQKIINLLSESNIQNYVVINLTIDNRKKETIFFTTQHSDKRFLAVKIQKIFEEERAKNLGSKVDFSYRIHTID